MITCNCSSVVPWVFVNWQYFQISVVKLQFIGHASGNISRKKATGCNSYCQSSRFTGNQNFRGESHSCPRDNSEILIFIQGLNGLKFRCCAPALRRSLALHADITWAHVGQLIYFQICLERECLGKRMFFFQAYVFGTLNVIISHRRTVNNSFLLWTDKLHAQHFFQGFDQAACIRKERSGSQLQWEVS